MPGNWRQEFYDYVYSFYGKHPGGLYLQELNLTRKKIKKYCDIYIDVHQLLYPRESLLYMVGCDSIDRERVRDIISNHESETVSLSGRPSGAGTVFFL